MNEPRFTPGPWEAVELNKGEALIVRPCDTRLPPICLVDRQANAWENASLIAATPDMHEALFKLRAAVDGLLREYAYLTECKEVADKALAKAVKP